MRALLLTSLVAALVLAGCSGGGEKLTEAEAREVAEQAMRDFAEDFSSGEGPIRVIEGQFEVEDENFSGATVEMRLERGNDDDMVVDLEMTGSGLTFEIEIYCGPEIEVMTWAGTSYGSRPSLEEPCQGAMQTDDGLDVEELGEAEMDDVEPHGDGSVTATFRNDTSEFVIEVDAEGRLTGITIEAEQGSGAFEIKYGNKRSLEVPTADQNVPADVTFAKTVEGTSAVWRVTESPQQPLTQDLEMRFEVDGEPVAAHPLEHGIQPTGEFVFEYDDADNDGRLTEGDVLKFTAPADSEAEPVLYDTWAGGNVGDNPIPGLGFMAFAGALVAAAFVRRSLR